MTDKKSANPFAFYEELITDGISPTINEFYELSQEIEFGKGEKKSIERVFMDGLTPLNLLAYLKSVSKKQSRKVLSEEESVLLDSAPLQIKSLTSKYQSDLNYYVSKLKKLPLTNTYPFFYEDLEVIKSDSLEKFKYLEQTETHLQAELITVTEESIKTTAPHKIKWNANINVLSTLFFDLLHGQKGPPIIEASPKVIQDFLINNFIDADGEPLKRSTIETHFSLEKPEKRAKIGSRIEIKNVTLKNKPL